MAIDKASARMEKALKGFHGRFKSMFGQFCVRVDENLYLSTGGNKILSDIKPEEYEICNINAGDLGEIFRRRPDINAILFGCSADTVKVSSETDSVPAALEDLARLTGAELKVVPDASPASILSGLRDSSVCLIKGTGAIATGTNCRKAVAGLHIVEKACEAEVHGKLIGGTVPLDRDLANAYRTFFLSEYTKRNQASHVDIIGFDEKEFALRSMLIEFGKDLVKKDLSYGSWGNLSVRLNDDEMLITPSSMDYFDINPEDIVKVNIRTLEYGDQRMPSSEFRMHAAGYCELPDCNAVIHTRSNGLSVFAACEAGFRLGNNELSGLIGDILVTDYAKPGTAELSKAVVSTLQHTHACVIPHHGGVFYGPSLDLTFAIAEAVEAKARNLLQFDVRPADDDE